MYRIRYVREFFFFNPCGWFVYQLLQQPVLTLLLFGMVGQLIPRFDALIMHPRQENASLPSRKTAFVLFFFLLLHELMLEISLILQVGSDSCSKEMTCMFAGQLSTSRLSPRKPGWQAAPPPWAKIIGSNSREGLVDCWSSGNIFLKPFGLCRVHRKHLKRGGKTWMVIGAITFKVANLICCCMTLVTTPWLAALHCRV